MTGRTPLETLRAVAKSETIAQHLGPNTILQLHRVADEIVSLGAALSTALDHVADLEARLDAARRALDTAQPLIAIGEWVRAQDRLQYSYIDVESALAAGAATEPEGTPQ